MNNPELKQYLQSLLQDKYQSFIIAPPEKTALRINSLKIKADEGFRYLDDLNINYKKLLFSPLGFVPDEKSIPISHTLSFFLGWFQYQGIASQIPPLALNPKPGETVLDMAASPGSKSTQIAAMMQNRGRLYLNDISRSRLQPLNANTQKAGLINQILLQLPGERLGNYLPEYFDKILVDAPCTALGTLAGSPEMIHWWSQKKLKKLSALQERLLTSAFKALKSNGEMVYSTCSIAPEENELVIQKLIENYPIEIISIDNIDTKMWGNGLKSYKNQSFPPSMDNAIRVLPQEHKMEGFFVIKLRKKDSFKRQYEYKKAAFSSLFKGSDAEIEHDLKEISDDYGIPMHFWQPYRFKRTKKRLWLLNSEFEEIPEEGFVSGGMLLGERKLFQWKLSNQSIQFLGRSITKRQVELNGNELKEIFKNSKMCKSGISDGYYVLSWKDKNIASLYVADGGLRMRTPHSLVLPEIL